MTLELNEIKMIRKKLGLNQHDLAKRADVSQSLIAKIESGRIDPTYTKARRIMEALQDLSKHQEIKAKDIMKPRIIAIYPQDSLKSAIKKMKQYEISQLPILDGKTPTGFVSETTIMESLIKGDHDRPVHALASEVPPIVPLNASVSVISGLLKHYPLVLVSDKGVVKGIITKSDLISKLYR